jgi:hypothetical protein
MTRRSTKALVALACLCAGLLAAQDAAQAKFRTYYTEFDVTVQGRLTEQWTKNVNHQYGCAPRTESSGGATIEFSTPRKTRVTAGAYTGFHGRPLADVQVERHGQSREVNLDGSPHPCGDAQPDRDGSACGARSFKSRIALPKTSMFGISLEGDKHQYSYDCPYPDPTPKLAGDFYESTSIIGVNESKIDWYPRLFGTCNSHGKHCHPGKRDVTFHFAKHVTSPYGAPGNGITGSYEADIEWTAKFHRVTKAHTGL